MPVQWGRNPAVSQSVFLLRDVIAARPAAAPANQDYYFLATDVSGGTLYQSTGSAWVQVAGPVTDTDITTFAGLTDVDITGQVDQQVFAWDAASGKYKPLPGITGDGSGGLVVAEAIYVGDFTYTSAPESDIAGPFVVSGQDTVVNGGSILQAIQLSGTLTDGRGAVGLNLSRSLDRAGYAVGQGALRITNEDTSGGVSPVPPGEPVLEIFGSGDGIAVQANDVGGFAMFGHAAPTVQPTGGAHTAAGTYGATEQTMLQAVYDAARAIGLLS